MNTLASRLLRLACVIGLASRCLAGNGNTAHIVIVLDASGSMKGEMNGTPKIVAAKAALKEVLKTMPGDTQMGLLVFSAANVKDWAYPLGPRDDAKLMAAIDLPQPNGSTPLGTFMKMGADSLLAARKANFGYGTYRLIIVTDGEANSEPSNLVAAHTRDIMSRGLIVDVIGVGMAKAHTLATQAHSYRGADDPAALRKAITEVFAEVGSTKNEQFEGDAFAVIAPLPDAIVPGVIEALSRNDNKPVVSTGVVREYPSTAPARPPRSPSAAKPRKGSAAPLIGVIAVIIGAFALFRKAKRK